MLLNLIPKLFLPLKKTKENKKKLFINPQGKSIPLIHLQRVKSPCGELHMGVLPRGTECIIRKGVVPPPKGCKPCETCA
jgi:hypothetical protein